MKYFFKIAVEPNVFALSKDLLSNHLCSYHLTLSLRPLLKPLNYAMSHWRTRKLSLNNNTCILVQLLFVVFSVCIDVAVVAAVAYLIFA